MVTKLYPWMLFIKSISSLRCSKWYSDIMWYLCFIPSFRSCQIHPISHPCQICQDSKNALQVELHIFPCAWAWGQPQKERFGGLGSLEETHWDGVIWSNMVATPHRTTKFMIEASIRMASGNTLKLLHQKGKSPKKSWQQLGTMALMRERFTQKKWVMNLYATVLHDTSSSRKLFEQI